MKHTHNSVGRVSRPLLFVVLTLLLVSACGIGLDAEARLERAETALTDGEYRAAIIDAKNILRDEPDNLAARLVLGRASVEIGDGASAEKEFRRALELGVEIDTVLVDLGRALLLLRQFEAVIDEIDPALAHSEPDKLAAMRIRGDALIGLRDIEAARDVFTEVLNADPRDLAAYLGVARTYIADGTYFQAREVLRNVLELDSTYIPAWLISGELATRTGDLDLAQSDYSRAALLAQKVGDRTGEMAALSGQANVVLSQENVDEARDILERMRLLAPDDPRTFLVSARIATSDKDWGKAQDDLQQVLRRVPNQRQAQMLLGYVHKEGGDLAQAEMYLSAVVNAVPGNSNARRLLAETRLLLDKAEEARRVLEPLLAEPTPGTAALSMAAAASFNLNDFEEATEILERSVDADPDNVLLRIQLAFAYYRASDAAKAEEILEAIPDDAIGNNEFRRDSLLVLSRMAQGDEDAALSLARDLQSRMPELSVAHTLAGAIEMSIGATDAARVSFDRASELSPDDVQTIRYLAQLDEAQDLLEAAKARYELILTLEPTDVRAMVSLARLALVAEDPSTAREWLQRARESDSKAVSPRGLLGAFLLAFREYSAAEEVLSEALELRPQDPRLLSMMGHAKLNQKFFRDAEFSFARAMELEPANPQHRFDLARTQSDMGNKSSAIATLQEAMGQTMSYIQSVGLLAALYVDTGNLEKARELMSRVRQQFPDSAMAFVLEAEIEAKAGNAVEAARAYDHALDTEVTGRSAVRAYRIRSEAGLDDDVAPLLRYLESRPLDSNMRMYLAQAYRSRGEVDSANEQYEHVLANDSDNYIAANNLAWSYYQSADPRAEEAARRAYEIEPNSGAVADTLGWILVEKGKREEGLEILRKADELSEGDPDIRYHLAAALATDGQVGSAKFMLEEVLKSGAEFANRDAAEKLLATL